MKSVAPMRDSSARTAWLIAEGVTPISRPTIRLNLEESAMTDVLDDVRDHSGATGLIERLKTAFMAHGLEDQRLAPQQTPAPQNLGTVMGPDMAQLAANLGRSLMEGRLGVLTAVFEAD